MTRTVIDALLLIAVLGAWLGCAGFARLRAPLDRMHCAAFVNWTTLVPISVAAFVADGPSSRALKLLLVTIVTILAGALLSHATGRALTTREADSART